MAPEISDGCYLRPAELGKRDHRRKRYEATAREAPQAMPRTMDVVLGGRGWSHRAGIGRKLEGKKGVKVQVLKRRPHGSTSLLSSL